MSKRSASRRIWLLALLSLAASATTATTFPTTGRSIPPTATWTAFKGFIKEAHRRGIRVITELVVNHTSDQHPWFQAARKAPPGSPERAFYVWSDSDDRYAGTRIIFIDTETSNWAWDPVANAYYWHRFYSHQPDLNFDNPRVLDEIIDVMRYWLDLGVDGLRLDAVPYLCEREGTNNENLARDACRFAAHPQRGRRPVSRPHAARRGQPVAGGHAPLFRRRRRMPHGISFPSDAAHVHGARAGGSPPDHRHPAADARDSQSRASGHCSCATTTNLRSRW